MLDVPQAARPRRLGHARRARAAQPVVGGNPREIAERIKAALEAARRAAPRRGSRSRARASSTSSSRRRGSTTCCATVVAGGRRATARRDALAGQRINLEFVSANPTGPLHAGGGRWVAVGDAIANLLAAQGAEVHREYYLNDTGNQLATFRDSLYARYRGEEPPEDGYQGAVPRRHGGRAARRARRRRRRPTTRASGATARSSTGLQDDLGRIGVHFDTWFSERTLHERGDVADVLRAARRARASSSSTTARAGCASTDFGDQRDRVLVRSDGTHDVSLQRPRVPPRQVRPRLHAPDRHLGRRPPRPGEVAAGRHGGARLRPAGEPEVMLGQFVKLLQDGARGAHLEAHRQHRHARRHPRRGRSRRRADDVPAAGHRLAADVRPRRRHRAVDGEPRLLRAVRARADRVDRAPGRRGRRRRAGRSSRSTCRCSRTSARTSCCARSRCIPTSCADAAETRAPQKVTHLGARLRARVPRLLPRLPRAHRRRRAHPGPAVADGGVPDRSRQRARAARRAARPTRWRASTTTTDPEPDA